ncbi:MAG: hypothetical protein WBA54_12075 [Acidaminobacteraceae bacterium]
MDGIVRIKLSLIPDIFYVDILGLRTKTSSPLVASSVDAALNERSCPNITSTPIYKKKTKAI